jgi:hypothetical protein
MGLAPMTATHAVWGNLVIRLGQSSHMTATHAVWGNLVIHDMPHRNQANKGTIPWWLQMTERQWHGMGHEHRPFSALRSSGARFVQSVPSPVLTWHTLRLVGLVGVCTE